jgi:hypothetical protein
MHTQLLKKTTKALHVKIYKPKVNFQTQCYNFINPNKNL